MTAEKEGFKSGFVGILGITNVGKSTFINKIVGRKLLITSDKVQTTRNRIRCIYNAKDLQAIFVDTPGLNQPQVQLSRHLLEMVYESVRELDLFVYMIEPWRSVKDNDQVMFKRLAQYDKPALLLVNKIDLAKSNQLEETLLDYEKVGIFDELIPISALKGINLESALDLIFKYLPYGPPYFTEDILTDRSESFIISEFIREQIYRYTRKEVPYHVGVKVSNIQEREDKDLLEIYADIYVSRSSQKGILIGKGGSRVKSIGIQARKRIEGL